MPFRAPFAPIGRPRLCDAIVMPLVCILLVQRRGTRKGRAAMLYQSFQAVVDAGQPAREWAGVLSEAMWKGWRGAPLYPASKLAALFELLALAVLTHSRPAFGIESVEVAGEALSVHEEVVLASPFGSL